MKMSSVACAAALAVVCALSGCAKKTPAPTGDPAARSASGPNAGSIPSGDGGTAAKAKDTEAFGTVKAKNVHTISLDFPSVVDKKLVSEGQRVKAGDVLFRFTAADYEAQISAMSLELQTARFELKKAEQEKQRLEEDLRIAQGEADKAEKDLSAKRDLFGMGAVAREEVEAAEKILTSARQRVRELSRSLEQYTAEGVNGLELPKARIANQERELARLKEQSVRSYISGSSIVADVRDGIVSEIGYAEGDVVSRERKLCSIMDMASLIVEANVSEEFIKDIRLGSAADIVPLADNSRTYKGKVTRISGVAVKVNGETVIQVELSLDSPDDFLKPNFNVDVKIY